jgi:fused signal recognition particle receptor
MFSLFKSKSEAPRPAGPSVAEAPQAPNPAPARAGWADRLKAGLAKTRNQLAAVFVGLKVDDALFEELEMALIAADCGVDASARLIAALRDKANLERIEDGETLKRALAALITELLSPLERDFDLERAQPLTVMIAGVNGVGKTTSIGKLAKYFQSRGKSVLLAAGDTFRAAAREQLVVWGERNNVAVIAHGGASGDTAAVIFDAVGAARARGIDVVVADTAGRLPTQKHLMDEIQKVKRVIAKADASAPHEVLLVIDANTGQNAVAQVKAFDDALNLTGLIVTKLDGTAKGGVLCAIARARPVPVLFIGIGEGIDDLRPFVARDFAHALLGLDG